MEKRSRRTVWRGKNGEKYNQLEKCWDHSTEWHENEKCEKQIHKYAHRESSIKNYGSNKLKHWKGR